MYVNVYMYVCFIYMYACIYVYVGMYVYECVVYMWRAHRCVCVLVCCTRICSILCWRSGVSLVCGSSQAIILFFCRLAQNLSSRLDWLVSEPQRSASVDLPTARIQVHITVPSMFIYGF